MTDIEIARNTKLEDIEKIAESSDCKAQWRAFTGTGKNLWINLRTGKGISLKNRWRRCKTWYCKND